MGTTVGVGVGALRTAEPGLDSLGDPNRSLCNNHELMCMISSANL